LQRKTLEQFICEAKETHGDDKFDYAETKYTNYNTKITIICNTCKNKFQTNPSTHLKGNGGCRVCYANYLSKNMTKTQTQFVEEAKKIHEDKYDYSLVAYIDSQTNIDIICKTHGKFKQTPNNHLRGKGCKKCATKKISENQKKSKDEFIKDAKKIHGDKYDYSKTDYINAKIKITIICKDHGEFKVEPSSHLSGTSCNKCHKTYSKPQIEWLKMLENELGIIVQHAENSDGEHKIKNSRYKADGYYENKNAIFEFHGCYYHGCKKCFPNRNETNKTTGQKYKMLYKQTKNKKRHCENNGYQYFRIWECKWKKLKNNNEKLQKYFEKINKKLK
jgi:hypothetical protein